MKLQNVEGLNYYDLPDTLDGYAVLEDDGQTLWLSCIISKEEGKGHFKKFLDEIEPKFTIKVPTPSQRMSEILSKRGYVLKQEFIEEEADWLDVMIKQMSKIDLFKLPNGCRCIFCNGIMNNTTCLMCNGRGYLRDKLITISISL